MSIPFPVRPRAARLAAAVSAALLLPLVAPPLRAQAAPQSAATELDRVEVRGVRPPIATVPTLDEARRRLAERAGGTGVVDAEAYRGGRVSTLVDALGFATGVFVQPRFGAEEARLSIRGSGLQRTFHGRGIELLQDGVPINLADGGFDFQAIEPLSARYVAVYRGANALEFGAATLGGAIDFVSPTGFDAPRATARVECGSFDYGRAQLALAGHGTRADGYVSVSAFGQDGFRAHATQETSRLFGNAGWRFSDTLDARVYLTHVDTRSELPGSLTRAQLRADASQANPGNIALDQRRDFRLDRIAGRLAWTPRDGSTLTVSAYYADKALDHPIFQVLRQDNRDAGVDARWRRDGTLGAHRTVLTAGLAYADGRTDDDRFANLGGRAGARTNAAEQRATNVRAFAELQAWLAPRWVLALGAQGVRAVRESEDRFVVAGRDESYARTYRGWSPKLGLRFDAAAGVQAFANLSRSYEPPSFGELAGGPGVTLVDAQRGTTAELGVRVQRAAVSLDAALYRARIDDELLALTDGSGNPLGTVNAGRTLHQGLELGVGWTPAEAWTLSLNALWNDFRFDDDPVYGDNALAGVPRHQLRVAVRFAPHARIAVTPSVEWSPDASWIDHRNTVTAPGYAIWNFRIAGDVARGWSWFVDGRNLADRTYVATTNVVADARGRDAANFLPGDGRAVYAGVEWRTP